MKSYVALLSAALGGLLIAGCASAPPAPPKPPPAPVAVATPPVEPPAQPAPAPVAKDEVVPVAPEVQAVVEKLTSPGNGAMTHTVADTTGFPAAMASLQPGSKAPATTGPVDSRIPTRGLTADGSTADLVVRDWTGLVLVPVDKEFAKLYSSVLQIVAIEAHPLTDGRIRVWVRLRNRVQRELPARAACTFYIRGSGEPGSARFYPLQIPAGETRDVFFVSPAGDLNKYTVSIGTENMVQ